MPNLHKRVTKAFYRAR